MASTSKSWFVANFEIISYIFSAVIIFFISVMSGMEGAITILISYLIYSGIYLILASTFIGAIILFIFDIGFAVFLFGPEKPMGEISSLQPIFMGIGVLSIIMGFIYAIYVYRNFSDIVSRVLTFRRSRADVYGMQLTYSIHKFFRISCAIFCALVGIIFSYHFTH